MSTINTPTHKEKTGYRNASALGACVAEQRNLLRVSPAASWLRKKQDPHTTPLKHGER